MKRFCFAAMLLCLLAIKSNAQTSPRQVSDQGHVWIVYNGDHKFSSKWGLHIEAQLRRADGVQSAQQLLLRPGINYHFSPAAAASVGYAWIKTYPYGDFPAKSSFPENNRTLLLSVNSTIDLKP